MKLPQIIGALSAAIYVALAAFGPGLHSFTNVELSECPCSGHCDTVREHRNQEESNSSHHDEDGCSVCRWLLTANINLDRESTLETSQVAVGYTQAIPESIIFADDLKNSAQPRAPPVVF